MPRRKREANTNALMVRAGLKGQVVAERCPTPQRGHCDPHLSQL
jgi:hypothetical protein